MTPDRKNFKVYNRYAHIFVELQDSPTEFISLETADAFKLNLNSENLLKLDVKYIFSTNGELENFSKPNVKIKKIFEDRNSFIYEIN